MNLDTKIIFNVYLEFAYEYIVLIITREILLMKSIYTWRAYFSWDSNRNSVKCIYPLIYTVRPWTKTSSCTPLGQAPLSAKWQLTIGNSDCLKYQVHLKILNSKPTLSDINVLHVIDSPCYTTIFGALLWLHHCILIILIWVIFWMWYVITSSKNVETTKYIV